MSQSDDHEYLREAIRLAAEHSAAGDGGPFGAVIVKGGEVVGAGWNRVTSANDPTAHAEVSAIRDACQNLESFSLEGCTVYSSCEPCPMCLAAIYWARLDRLVFAATRADAAAIGFDDAMIYEQVALPIDERILPTDHALQDEARAIFAAWEKQQNKTMY